MWRTGRKATTPGEAAFGYKCRECHQSVADPDRLVVGEFLGRFGDVLRMTRIEDVQEGGSVEFQEASIRLAELGREMVTAQGDRIPQIIEEMGRLKELQASAKARPARVVESWVADPVQTFQEDWEAATDDEERRAVLGDALERILVRRGKPGQTTDAQRLARMEFQWRPAGQIEPPSDEELATWAN